MKKQTPENTFLYLNTNKAYLLFIPTPFYLLSNMQVRNNSRAWTLNVFSVSDLATLAIKGANQNSACY